MITTTKIQARQRFSILSPSLQDAMFSAQTVEIINLIANQNNLPDEKAGKIADIAGWVILGFLHVEDVPRELQEALGVPQPAAVQIARSLENKLFNPLKDDIEKGYAPVPRKEELAGPTVIQEIVPTGPLVINATPLSPSKVQMPPLGMPITKPKLSDVGWSRTTPEQPMVKLSQTVPSAPPKMSGLAMPPPPPKTAVPPVTQKGVGEFERLAIRSGEKPPAPPTAPAARPIVSPAPAAPSTGQPPAAMPAAPKPPAAVTEPAPIIIHEDTTFKPQQQAPNLHLVPSLDRFDMQKAGPPAPVRPAVLELGKATPPPRPVHYTEYIRKDYTEPASPASAPKPSAPQPTPPPLQPKK